jgi:hypothetical protein
MRSFVSAFTLAALVAAPLAAQQAAPTGFARPAHSAAQVALAPASVLPAALVVAPTRAESPAPAPSADNFGSTGFSQFMASPAGRMVRVVAGAALIGGGIAVGGGGGTALAVVGAVPLSAGVLDLCYISGLLGGPWKGADIRAMKKN